MDKNCCGSCAMSSTMKSMKTSSRGKMPMMMGAKKSMPAFSSGIRKSSFVSGIQRPKVRY